MIARNLPLLLLGLACRPTTPTPEASPAAPAELSMRARLVRASLDLRGARPTPAELAEVEADPDAYPALVERYLADPGFPVRVRAIYADITLTLTEYYPILELGYGGADDKALWSSIGEEPLRIFSTLAEEDLPWTEAVTGDWTVVDERLAAYWPVDYPEGATGWQKSRYTDGRPAVGVLATNGLWWRYTSTESNANRKRANVLSRVFLCNDYLSHPVNFDPEIDLSDESAVANAVATAPGCVNCHVSVDPLAGFFYGFWSDNAESAIEATLYHAERERNWTETTGIAPAYFGQPAESLWDLGRLVAADPRFVNCPVEQVYSALLRRPVKASDADALTAIRAEFLANDLTLRSIFREIALGQTAWSRAEEAPEGLPRKMITVDQLASSVEALTGFRWSVDGQDMLTSDIAGLRTLAGGADGYSTVTPVTRPIPTLSLVVERVAEAAGDYAVTAEAAMDGSDRRLFTLVDPTDSAPEQAAIAAQIAALTLAFLSQEVEPDSEEVLALVALWQALLAAEGTPERAWAMLLSALLRDPDFLFY